MKETRITELRAEQSTVEDSKAFVLSGRPIVYNTPTQIRDGSGSYREIIQAGALDETDLSDVRLLVNHNDASVPLARTPKTLTLNVDAEGLTFEAELPDTEEGKSVYTAVKRGDLSGMSFAFKVPEDGDEYDATTNTRTITKIEKVYECSVVSFPAYPTTSVEARSVRESEQKALELRKSSKILINQIVRERL